MPFSMTCGRSDSRSRSGGIWSSGKEPHSAARELPTLRRSWH
jgi:hypothetical protein